MVALGRGGATEATTPHAARLALRVRPREHAFACMDIFPVDAQQAVPRARDWPACGMKVPAAQGALAIRAQMPIEWRAGRPLPIWSSEQGLEGQAHFAGASLEVPLAFVPSLRRAQGRAFGRVRLGGSWAHPELYGQVDVRDGAVQISALGQELHDISGRVFLRGNTVVIPRINPLRARDANGHATLFGETSFKGVRPELVEIEFKLDHFPIRQEGSILAWTDGSFDLKANADATGTEAVLRASRLSVRVPDELGRSVQRLSSHPDVMIVGRAQAQHVAADTRYPMHLVALAPDPFWIRRTDFATQVSAELDITYVDPHLYIGGYATLHKGFFEVFGKRFEIQDGSLAFSGQEDLQPRCRT